MGNSKSSVVGSQSTNNAANGVIASSRDNNTSNGPSSPSNNDIESHDQLGTVVSDITDHIDDGAKRTRQKSRNPRMREVSSTSLIFSRNDGGYNYIKNSVHSSIRPSAMNPKYYPSPEEERAAFEDTSCRSSIPFDKTVEEVYYGVYDGPVLGDGVTGEVRKVTNKETGEMFALKRLDMMKIKSERQAMQLLEEIEIMCQLDHPNIIKLEEVYESDEYIYLVEELCKGGELFDRLDEQPGYHYNEEDSAKLINQIVAAVQYLHSQGIVHRDLKLENFLFTDPNSDSGLKMIDFGLSKHMKYGEKEKDAVGTPYTVAPEVIRGSYTEKCDVWAIGVIAYLLLSGDPPFGGCSGEPLRQVRKNILSGSYKYEPIVIWDKVSDEAKAFIDEILQLDPSNRPSSRQLLWNAWLQRYKQTKEDDSHDGNESIPDCLQKCIIM